MRLVETLSTAGMPRHQQVTYWNKIACRNITEETVIPASSNSFWGCMRFGQLGVIRIVEVTSDPAKVIGSRIHAADSREPEILVHMQLHGASTLSQGGYETTLHPGDFTLCNGALPRHVSFDERVTMLIFCIPSNAFRRRITFPEIMALSKLSGTSGSPAVTVKCLRSIWDGCSDISPRMAPRFADVVVDLLSAALASQPGMLSARPASLTRSRMQMIGYIESRLTDCTLTPASVARRFAISSRHLYTVFGKGESATKYILRRRLEESARILADPLHSARHVGVVALDHGFASISQYCTAFRRHYGVTPREYRFGSHEKV
jgi:AraC-like DNA-binding protein